MKSLRSMRVGADRGFTLVEALVVMAILSIVMLAIMSFIIPTQQSMKMQSNVSDVQSNLNLAINVMTSDLLMAGFLVDPAFDPPVADASCPSYWKGDNVGDDMAPGYLFWQGDDTTEDNNDLTIRTRILGKAFTVVDDVVVAGGNSIITPSHADMWANFCSGNTVKMPTVRVFNPVSMRNLDDTGSDYSFDMTPASGIVQVVGCTNNADPALRTFTIDKELNPDTSNGLVIVGSSATVSGMHTIRYRVNNGALERIVDGIPQYLARGVTSVNFAYSLSPSSHVKQVAVTLTGVIQAMRAGEAELGQKTRSLTTTVHLRNSL